jgi:hypothetical protein
MDKEQARGLERHAQTVIVLVLTALLLWVGNTTQEMAVAIGKMEVEVQNLKNTDAKLVDIESRLGSIEVTLAGLTAAQARSEN